MKNHKDMFEAILRGETLTSKFGDVWLDLDDDIIKAKNIENDCSTIWRDLMTSVNVHGWEIKPTIIEINGIEFQAPVKAISPSKKYWVIESFDFSDIIYYCGDRIPTHLITSGLVHTKKEDATNHLNAILSFTRNP